MRAALQVTGMTTKRVDSAIIGSMAFKLYVTSSASVSDAKGRELLDATVQNICRRHWLNNYTWLPCACALCGTPFSDPSKNDVYGQVMKAYGGYPKVWPWGFSVGTEMAMYLERDRLADRMVQFYADSMMLDSLFQRMVKCDLHWFGDHVWLSRIRDAWTQKQVGRRHHITFVVAPCPAATRVAQLVQEAEFVGGYRIRWGASHMHVI